MKTYALTEIPELRVLGRNDGEMNPLTLFWHGSGIELTVKARELWIDFHAEYEAFEQWISIWIDGALISRHILLKGDSCVPIFLNADRTVAHKVRVLKEVQPMTEDSVHIFQICGVKTDGDFCPTKELGYRLEFIGDSLTSGEGTIGAIKEMTWNSMVMGASFAYPLLTADALNADVRIMSKGGWGVFCSYDGDPTRNIPEHYESICSVLSREKEQEKGSCKPNDFASWQPDAIVINLGTNDDSAFRSEPAFPYGEEGGLLDQKILPNGEYEEASVKRVQDAVVNFLKVLRKNNPNAFLLWAHSSFEQELSHYIVEAVEAYVKETKDAKAEAIKMPTLTEELKGSREHPGRPWHNMVVEYLTKLLEEKLS